MLTIFYALAGGKHVLNAERASSENWAMGSDLWAALVLAAWLVVWIGGQGRLGEGEEQLWESQKNLTFASL